VRIFFLSFDLGGLLMSMTNQKLLESCTRPCWESGDLHAKQN